MVIHAIPYVYIIIYVYLNTTNPPPPLSVCFILFGLMDLKQKLFVKLHVANDRI